MHANEDFAGMRRSMAAGRLSANRAHSPKRLADAVLTAGTVSRQFLVLRDAPVKRPPAGISHDPSLSNEERYIKKKNPSVFPTACASLFTVYFCRQALTKACFKKNS